MLESAMSRRDLACRQAFNLLIVVLHERSEFGLLFGA